MLVSHSGGGTEEHLRTPLRPFPGPEIPLFKRFRGRSLSCLPWRMEWRSASVQGLWSIPSGEMDGKGYLHPQDCSVFATTAANEVGKTRRPTTGPFRQSHLRQILA